MNRSLILVAVSLLATACRSQVQHGLEERDANEAVSALVSRGFDARKIAEKGKKPTWAIELDDEHAIDALRVLTELKLPRPARTTTREVTSQVGLIETPGAERLRQLEAQEGDLEQLLEGMEGVASAGVELVVPGAPRPGLPVIPSKASALLRVHPGALERIGQQRDAIRALIAGAVEGLKPDEVVVVLDAVTTQVTPPTAAPSASERLRTVVVVMGLILTALAAALVVLAVRYRRLTQNQTAPSLPAASPEVPTARRAPTPAQRPVVNPNVQRRAA